MQQLQQAPPVQNRWSVVVPDEMKSSGNAVFNIKEDKSVLLSGPNVARDTYELVIRSDEEAISALRVEALRDPSTVNGGAGRGSNGNFVLSEIEIEVASKSNPTEFSKIRIASAEADYSQANFSIDLAIDGRQPGGLLMGIQRSKTGLQCFLLRNQWASPEAQSCVCD